MKKRIFVVLTVLCLLVPAVIPAQAAKPVKLVDDYADLLSFEEEVRVENAIREASAEASCDFYVATYEIPLGIVRDDSGYRYTGEDFLREYGLSSNEDIVILIVSKQGTNFYYDMYTFGDAYDRISNKEVNYILDHETVYDAIKSGRVADGVCAFLPLSAQGYLGRVGASYWIIATVSLILALLIGGFACGSVYAQYKQKNKSVDYPLDRFAKLELTRKEDHFNGTFITKRIIASNNGGGRGGGSFHGGGGGHRGGR